MKSNNNETKQTTFFSEEDFSAEKEVHPAGVYPFRFNGAEEMEFTQEDKELLEGESGSVTKKLRWDFYITKGPLEGKSIILDSGRAYRGKRATLVRMLKQFLAVKTVTKEQFLAFNPTDYEDRTGFISIDEETFKGIDFNRLVSITWD